MNSMKIVYGIDILDYHQMVIACSGKWFVKTEYSKEQIDEAVRKIIHDRRNLNNFSLKKLASEIEKMGYFKIIEDLTDVLQHTIEIEIETGIE